MPYCSKVFSFHLRPLISSMPTGAPMLFRKLGERGIAFAEQQIARLLGGVLIDANAAAAHFQHHRQQVDFEPIGVAGSFPIQDRVELLEQHRACSTASISAYGPT